MGKSTISMAILNSFLLVHQRVATLGTRSYPQKKTKMKNDDLKYLKTYWLMVRMSIISEDCHGAMAPWRHGAMGCPMFPSSESPYPGLHLAKPSR